MKPHSRSSKKFISRRALRYHHNIIRLQSYSNPAPDVMLYFSYHWNEAFTLLESNASLLLYALHFGGSSIRLRQEVTVQSINHPPKARLLCVDNHASRNLVVYLLEQASYEVVTASSITEGWQLAQSASFDLFLLNHKLSPRGETKLCRDLSQLAPQTPILFYTSITYPYHRRRAIRCGLSGQRMRPIEASEVVQTVSYYMNHQSWPAGVVCDEAPQSKNRGLSVVSKVLTGLGIGAVLMLTVMNVQRRRAHGTALSS
jgi:CheY-like chemotaxis protein